MTRAICLSCHIAIFLLVLASVAKGQNARRELVSPYGCMWNDRPNEGITHLRCKKADFSGATFEFGGSFFFARFESTANFSNAEFKGMSEFDVTKFDSLANFSYAKFEDYTLFSDAKFYNQANFNNTSFNGVVNFNHATFYSFADFGVAKFNEQVDFSSTIFYSKANFNLSEFENGVNFTGTSLWDAVDFRNSDFDSASVADFTRTSIRDTVRIGTWSTETTQRFDFRQVNFRQTGREVRPSDSIEVTIPGAAVVLHAPAELDLQVEKINFLHLADSLSYFQKSDIITYLKYNSFSDDNQSLERFELDYLLARSTMHQQPSGIYDEYPLYHYKLWWNYLYYYLMGFGYRPFRIFLWAGGMILFFGIYYRWKMPRQIYNYVQNDGKKQSQSVAQKHTSNIDKKMRRNKLVKIASRSTLSSQQSDSNSFENLGQRRLKTPWIYCLYFSTMVVFSFRLKQKLFAYFDSHEQRIIVIQWVLGFLIYVGFLTLAKSGSILHQLKVLFVG